VTAKRYEKVRARLPGGTRTLLLEVVSRPHRPGERLYGYVVNRDGSRSEGRVVGGLSHHYVVLAPADVVWRRPLRMDLHYGELVEATS
jgi:hypothetical protein